MLQSERLAARELTSAHTDTLYDMLRDPDVMRFWAQPLDATTGRRACGNLREV